MNICFVIPGKFKSTECRELVSRYLKLSNRFASVEFVELPLTKSLAAEAAQDQALEKFLEKKGPRAYLTLLDEKGRTFTSRNFADKIAEIRDGSHSQWIIAVGGAHEFGAQLKSRAKFLWSLSPLTFPHELAAAVAAEQIFRGFSILANHPYHND